MRTVLPLRITKDGITYRLMNHHRTPHGLAYLAEGDSHDILHRVEAGKWEDSVFQMLGFVNNNKL